MKSIDQSGFPAWNFHGECLVISGGARGIGAGLVRHFHRCGAEVLFGDTDTVGARQLCEELNTEDRKVHFVETDFSSPGAWTHMKEVVEQRDLHPSLVISNVGIGSHALTEEITEETYDRILSVNLRSAWLAAREFVSFLRQRKGSSLLFIGSVMAHFGMSGHSLYSASKSALSGLLQSLCVEFAPWGIRVNMLVPGYILNDPPFFYRQIVPPEYWTEFFRRFGPQMALANPPVQPLPFWGSEEDIAQAASFLHSPAARYITGAELRVDGGLLCQSPIRPGTGNEAWAWTPDMKQWLTDHALPLPPDSP